MTDTSVRAYRSVEAASEQVSIIKRSRFIGRCWPIRDEAEALSLLEGVRKRCFDASHNCYAYSLGAEGGVARYSDDGEPSGTAGLPMMDVLKKRGVTDVLVVVTRYFGGILLGAGGLVRAYTASCSEALRQAGVVDYIPCEGYTCRVPYERWDTVKALIEGGGRLASTEYSEAVTCSFFVKRTESESFLSLLTERSDGRVQAEWRESRVFPFPAEEA